MLVYRIALTIYANQLIASGRAARWNPNDVKMIYTASSRSLACLENVVHRSQAGLNQLFNIMTIEYPDTLPIQTINLKELPDNWADFDQMRKSQQIGENWLKGNETAILRVPSSIIAEETNYLLNPEHNDFKLIRLIKSERFTFDKRLKH